MSGEWEPYVPDADRPWDLKRAAHLYRRAGFGATRAELDEALRGTPAEAVDRLTAAEEDFEPMGRTVASGDDPRRLAGWWLYAMTRTRAPLRERATLFWHGHFATSAAKVAVARLMFEQNLLLRRRALGDFAAMVQEISRDPAMLVYLDSAVNRRAHPNENYARELMELFCLGEGNYTEKDIREIARCFTGWEVVRDRFKFNRSHHDEGAKSFLGQSGRFGGEDAVRIVLEQPSASRFIAARLARFFVSDESVPIEPLAVELRESGWDVGRVVGRILRSNLFFDSIGRKIRSPVEMVVGLLRALEGSTDLQVVADDLERLGQGLFHPPSVKGWDGGRTWINSSTLLGRANLVHRIVTSEKTRLGDVTAADLEGLLLAVPLPDGVSLPGDLREAVHRLSVLPEFHLF